MNNNKERKDMENVALKTATVIGLGLVLLIGILLLVSSTSSADDVPTGRKQ